MKFLGLIDNNNVIKDGNVYFRDIDLDDPEYELPELTFDMRGTMRLGFRQLANERWSAAPLYILSIENQKAARAGRFPGAGAQGAPGHQAFAQSG